MSVWLSGFTRTTDYRTRCQNLVQVHPRDALFAGGVGCDTLESYLDRDGAERGGDTAWPRLTDSVAAWTEPWAPGSRARALGPSMVDDLRSPG